MSNLNISDTFFIHFLAPTLCGIKPANLFTLSNEQFSEEWLARWKLRMTNHNLSLSAFRISPRRWMIFAYDSAWISQLLADRFVQTYLVNHGYTHPADTGKTLQELFRRLQHQDRFPHEVGLFLGYPLNDVIGFEENQGRNCTYCGYWKSYSDPAEAQACCARYTRCSRQCRKWFEEGLSVSQIIHKYRKEAENAA